MPVKKKATTKKVIKKTTKVKTKKKVEVKKKSLAKKKQPVKKIAKKKVLKKFSGRPAGNFFLGGLAQAGTGPGSRAGPGKNEKKQLSNKNTRNFDGTSQ